MNGGQPTIFENVSEEELRRLAHLLAPMAHAGDCITLEGDLGAGKSVFARAFIRTAMGDEALDVPSPTYTLVQTYAPPSPRPEIWHVDLYRVEKEQEITELGLEDALGDAVLLIEWPERLGAETPEDRLAVMIGPGESGDKRTVTLKAGPGWMPRLNKITLIRQ